MSAVLISITSIDYFDPDFGWYEFYGDTTNLPLANVAADASYSDIAFSTAFIRAGLVPGSTWYHWVRAVYDQGTRRSDFLALGPITISGSGVGIVTSVAGKTGDVTLVAGDISDAGTAGKTVMQASTAAAIRAILGLAAVATSGAAADISGLGSLALLSSVTAALISDASANGRSLLTAANYAAMKVLLAIAAGDVSGLGALATASSVTLSQVSDASANGRSLVAAANYAAMRVLLGLVIGTDVQAYDAELAALAGLASAANKIPRFTGSGTADLLGFDTDGTLAANSDTVIASQKAVKTYVDTHAGTTYSAGTGLGLTGTVFAINDAELLAIAGLTSAADKLPYFTGSGTAALADFTGVARTLVAQTTQALMRTAGLGLSANGSSLVSAADYAAMRVLLGVAQSNYLLVTLATNQNFTTATVTNINFDTVAQDSAGWWDATNHNYKPLVAGRYLVCSKVVVAGTLVLNKLVGLYIYKNSTGVDSAVETVAGSVAQQAAAMAGTIVSVNGSTDTISARIYCDGTSPNLSGSTPPSCSMTITYLGP